MDRLLRGLTFFASLGSGLIAGLFFCFSTFMMIVLAKLPKEEGMTAMQSINVNILNPWFTFVFMGTGLACAAIAVMAFLRLGEPGSGYLLAGSLLYLLGCIVVTMMFNVPLNDALAAATTNADGLGIWSDYLVKWVPWNHVRTFAAIASLAAFVLAFRKLP